ncbi:METL4 protein, partial [Oxylabes madagascariensis]|nr:METL4 protein [Oxylabes madagascariensis]
MSVVHRLTAGWLVDHLSFINQCGYEICDSFAHPGGVTRNTSVTSTEDYQSISAFAATPSSSDGPPNCPGNTIETEGKRAKIKYVFREEFFDISKPHIAAAPEQQLCQGCPEVKLNCNSSMFDLFSLLFHRGMIWILCCCFLLILQKRKRKCVFNQGELDALEYHSKVGWKKHIFCKYMLLDFGCLQSGGHGCKQILFFCRKNNVPQHIVCGLAELCEMAKQFPAVNESDHQAVCVLEEETSSAEQDLLSCVMENSSNSAKIIMLMGQKYLVPPKSSFLLSDISCLQPLLNYKKKYDVIVIDPPWENKYSHLSSWQIKQIPVPALAAPNCLVVMWVTNRQKHLRFCLSEIKEWNPFLFLAPWGTVLGKSFADKASSAGRFSWTTSPWHRLMPFWTCCCCSTHEDIQDYIVCSQWLCMAIVNHHQLIVSIPCSLHSHKPPLAAVLAEFIKPDVECLELFARNLQPGWTSWGNEVLKFQHIDYFTLLQNE